MFIVIFYRFFTVCSECCNIILSSFDVINVLFTSPKGGSASYES